MRRIASACGLVLVACLLLGCPLERVPRQGLVTDRQGRAMFLHGFNMDDSSTYGPVTPGALSRDDFQRIASYGFNFVRMVLFWNGLEHVQGIYDESYLDRISEMLDWAEESHVTVMLDFHQDQYNTRYGGRGMPDWTVRDEGLPFWPLPWPLQSITPAVRKCYDHFYGDEDLSEAYVAAWMVVINRFKDRPNVIGYDLMNEPFIGNIPLPEFESTTLPAFYARLATAIRSVDPTGWIFYEPVSFTVNMGLLPTSGPPKMPFEKMAYAPHFYQLGLNNWASWDGSEATMRLWENYRTQEAAIQGAPMLLGEFGVPWTHPTIDSYIAKVDEMIMRSGTGWAIWLYGKSDGHPFDPLGNPQANLLPLIHTYAQRIAGEPVSFAYDQSTRIFDLTFREKDGVAGPTEIYIPARLRYPEGWTLDVSDPLGTWSAIFDESREVLSLETDPAQDEHAIRIRPLTQ